MIPEPQKQSIMRQIKKTSFFIMWTPCQGH